MRQIIKERFNDPNWTCNKLHLWNIYINGARDMLLKLRDYGLLEEARPKNGIPHAKGDELVLHKALIDLLLYDKSMLVIFIRDFRRIWNKAPMPIRHIPSICMTLDSCRFPNIELTLCEDAYFSLNILVKFFFADSPLRTLSGHTIFNLVFIVESKAHCTKNQIHDLKRKMLFGVNLRHSILNYTNISAFELRIVFQTIEKPKKYFALFVGNRHLIDKQSEPIVSVLWRFRKPKRMFYKLVIQLRIFVTFIFTGQADRLMSIMTKEYPNFNLLFGKEVKQLVDHLHIRFQRVSINLLPLYFLTINRGMSQHFRYPAVKFIQEFIVEYYPAIEIGIIWAIFVAFVKVNQIHILNEKRKPLAPTQVNYDQRSRSARKGLYLPQS